MKHLYLTTLITISISFSSCKQEQSKHKENNSKSENSKNISNETITTQTTDTLKNTITEEDFSNSDLTKMNLKGEITSVSYYTTEIDDEGFEFGMGGYHEGYKFNQLGNIVSKQEMGCCGMESTYHLYQYSNDQLLLRVFTFYSETEPNLELHKDSFDLKEKYFYNDDNLLAKKKQINDDTTLLTDHAFKYNEDNLVYKEEINSPQKGNKTVIKYSYELGKITKAFIVNDIPDYTLISYYNDDQLLTKEELIDSKFHLFRSFEYTFDEFDNWITKTETSYYQGSPDSKSFLRTERTITYKL